MALGDIIEEPSKRPLIAFGCPGVQEIKGSLEQFLREGPSPKIQNSDPIPN